MLGAIADDVTGAVDLASNLVSRGHRVQLRFGAPRTRIDAGDADAVVVALPTRTAPVADAVALSVAALDALTDAGADRIYVKYCSTFDSTPAGNIGPVCDAVLDRLGASFTVVVPSFPANGRTVFQGHLFVGDVLLSESSLATHPLTPMTDANIVRVLQRQTPAAVGHVPWQIVAGGSGAVREALAALAGRGIRYAVVDAISDDDLSIVADASSDLAVITGGSGLALGLPVRPGEAAAAAPGSTLSGPRLVLVGSASHATRAQLAHAERAGVPVVRLPIDDPRSGVDAALARLSEEATADPDAIVAVTPEASEAPVDATTRAGAERAAALERAFGLLARRFVDAGGRRLLVAGGETSGAVVAALGVDELRLGEVIDPGVAWTYAEAESAADGTGGTGDAGGAGVPVALALKSGNFGGEAIFTDAWELLR